MEENAKNLCTALPSADDVRLTRAEAVANFLFVFENSMARDWQLLERSFQNSREIRGLCMREAALEFISSLFIGRDVPSREPCRAGAKSAREVPCSGCNHDAHTESERCDHPASCRTASTWALVVGPVICTLAKNLFKAFLTVGNMHRSTGADPFILRSRCKSDPRCSA